jgi:hypothetical protein
MGPRKSGPDACPCRGEERGICSGRFINLADIRLIFLHNVDTEEPRGRICGMSPCKNHAYQHELTY